MAYPFINALKYQTLKNCQRTFPAWLGNEVARKFNEDKCEVTQVKHAGLTFTIQDDGLRTDVGVVLVLWSSVAVKAKDKLGIIRKGAVNTIIMQH